MKKRFHIALVKKNRKKVPSISVETHSQSISEYLFRAIYLELQRL